MLAVAAEAVGEVDLERNSNEQEEMQDIKLKQYDNGAVSGEQEMGVLSLAPSDSMPYPAQTTSSDTASAGSVPEMLQGTTAEETISALSSAQEKTQWT